MRSAILAVVAAACSAPTITGVRCETAQDCNLFEVAGTCEPSGYCSYPDATCAGGRRYTPGAGDGLANICLGGELLCGGKDQACCGTGSCGPDLACVGETTATCQCGAETEPCCDGVSCAAGLLCGGSGCAKQASVLQVAVGRGHVCALRANRTVACWGYDTNWSFHVAGHATPVFSPTPTTIANLSDVVELRSAEMHACARKTDNTLWCWGHNEHGQLGDGTTTSTLAAVQVGGLTNVTRFDAGTFHTCAVASYNATPGLWCWGRGGHKGLNGTAATVALGRLGNNDVVDSAVPVAVDLSAAAPTGQSVKLVSAGKMHSCMVMSDDTVWCWGRGTDGQLGTTVAANTKVPVEVNLAGITIPPAVTVDEVSCNDGRREGSTCIRLSNGAVYCWGNNAEGQLGDGTTTARNVPSTPVSTTAIAPAKLAALASAMRSRCGRATDGSVLCWGANTKGLLGLGIVNGTFATPSRVPGLNGISQLDMSHNNACAVDATNRLWCWGNNQRGQITFQLPTTKADASVPTPVEVKLL